MSSENVLQCLEQLDRFYGGVHIIFCGDSHQLLPVGVDLIWEDYHILWHNVINSFIELEGKWPFAEPRMGGGGVFTYEYIHRQ
jgi:hypothetical protein